MIRLDALTRPDLIFTDLAGSSGSAVLKILADRLAARLEPADAGELYAKLIEREQLGSTGIGHGVAIPHCKLAGLAHPVLAVGIAPRGVDFGAIDQQPVKVFFLIVSPVDAPAEHLQVLAAISKWVKADHHVARILEHPEPETVYSLLTEADG